MTNPVQSGDLGSSADADTHRVAETPVVSGHTPGPWKAVEGDYSDGWRVIMDESGPVIGEAVICERIGGFADTDEEEAEQEATARLISAAPDLLAVVNAFRLNRASIHTEEPLNGALSKLWDLADQAAAKATGETQ